MSNFWQAKKIKWMLFCSKMGAESVDLIFFPFLKDLVVAIGQLSPVEDLIFPSCFIYPIWN